MYYMHSHWVPSLSRNKVKPNKETSAGVVVVQQMAVKNRLRKGASIWRPLWVSFDSFFFLSFLFFFLFPFPAEKKGLGSANVIDCGPRFGTSELYSRIFFFFSFFIIRGGRPSSIVLLLCLGSLLFLCLCCWENWLRRDPLPFPFFSFSLGPLGVRKRGEKTKRNKK